MELCEMFVKYVNKDKGKILKSYNMIRLRDDSDIKKNLSYKYIGKYIGIFIDFSRRPEYNVVRKIDGGV